jgi:hypothetical protein
VLRVEPRPDPGASPIEARYVRSFLVLRAAIGALGVALPVVLVLVDKLAFHGTPFPRNSLSAYYYSGMREWFVGTLAATGAFLVGYKVSERNLDNALSGVAGTAAALIALFPTGRPSPGPPLTPLQDLLGETAVKIVHFSASGIFIGALGVLCVCFGIREGRRPRRPGTRPPEFWRLYHFACASAIGLAIVWIVATWIFGGPRWSLLLGEWVSAWAFGFSWLLKGLEIDTLLGRQAGAG